MFLRLSLAVFAQVTDRLRWGCFYEIRYITLEFRKRPGLATEEMKTLGHISSVKPDKNCLNKFLAKIHTKILLVTR